MPQRLFDGRLDLGRTDLPFRAAGGGFGQAAEFFTVGDPIGLDLKPVVVEDPFLDLEVGGGLTQHGAPYGTAPCKSFAIESATLFRYQARG
jgi:hypothetical protein